jgi:hypothetical protein
MSRAVRFFVLCVTLLASSAVGAAEKSALPRFRPAVLGSGTDTLINRIDRDALLKKGQKAAAVMFCAVVAESGDAVAGWTYRGTPESEALVDEVEKRLVGVKFTPPIYNHQRVKVLIYGTVLFTPDEKPHVWIFLNQDPHELNRRSDLIAPQPVIGADSNFRGLHPPPDVPIAVTGTAGVKLKVDATGALQRLDVVNEEPPLLGFGAAAYEDLESAKFIPAFRDGDPAESDSMMIVSYKADEIGTSVSTSN